MTPHNRAHTTTADRAGIAYEIAADDGRWPAAGESLNTWGHVSLLMAGVDLVQTTQMLTERATDPAAAREREGRDERPATMTVSSERRVA